MRSSLMKENRLASSLVHVIRHSHSIPIIVIRPEKTIVFANPALGRAQYPVRASQQHIDPLPAERIKRYVGTLPAIRSNEADAATVFAHRKAACPYVGVSRRQPCRRNHVFIVPVPYEPMNLLISEARNAGRLLMNSD